MTHGTSNMYKNHGCRCDACKAAWAETHRDLIAGEILATSFEFGEPADGVEIGDGVRVIISKI